MKCRVLIGVLMSCGLWGTGCANSDTYMCNIYYGTMAGKLEPDDMENIHGDDSSDAEKSCMDNPAIQDMAEAKTGSPTVICVCGHS